MLRVPSPWFSSANVLVWSVSVNTIVGTKPSVPTAPFISSSFAVAPNRRFVLPSIVSLSVNIAS